MSKKSPFIQECENFKGSKNSSGVINRSLQNFGETPKGDFEKYKEGSKKIGAWFKATYVKK